MYLGRPAALGLHCSGGSLSPRVYIGTATVLARRMQVAMMANDLSILSPGVWLAGWLECPSTRYEVP